MPTSTEAIVVPSAGANPNLQSILLSELQPTEVLVEIHATGICHTDIACSEGKLPVGFPCVLGHEGAGIILKTGSQVTDLSTGDKVLLSYSFCKECPQCISNNPAYCEKMLSPNFGGCRPDGSRNMFLPDPAKTTIHSSFFGQSSFSKLAVVNHASIIPVHHDIPLELFAPLGCGIQTGAGAVLNSLDVSAGSSIAIFGLGAVGLSAVMAAKMRGAATIIVVDLQRQRLEVASEMGASHTLLGGKDVDILEQILNITPGRTGVKYAVDCTGVPAVVESMIDCLATRGRGVSVGAPPPGKRAGVDVFAHLTRGKQYFGSHQGDSVAREMIPFLIEQHKKGLFPFEKMITTYDYTNYQQAFEDMKQGKVIKPVLKWR